jgi:hypothetical protein
MCPYRYTPVLAAAALLTAIAVVRLAGADVSITAGPAPWSLVFLADGRALVSERIGRIRLIEDGRLVAAPVAELSAVQGIEGGLLALLCIRGSRLARSCTRWSRRRWMAGRGTASCGSGWRGATPASTG